MSTPKKPIPAATPRTSLAVPPAVELKLTLDEKRLIAAFRTTDDRGRRETLSEAERQAADWPCRPVPTLRLILGGAA